MKKLLWCMVLSLAFMVPGSMAADKAVTWTIFMYICGSDLEEFAVSDIEEMLAAKLPANVQIYLQTGGAKHWSGYDISSKKISRYLIKNGSIKLLSREPQASMGDPKTFASFLEYGLKNQRSDRNMLVLWNHGGGAALGVAFDLNFKKDGMEDSLSLNEIKEAFGSVAKKGYQPHFEIIGFDACLMATLDTAMAVSDYGDYMVASQEVSPGSGWMYTDWLNYLGKHPDVESQKLAKKISDTYFDSVSGVMETTSVVDLKKVRKLYYYYNMLGIEAIEKGDQDSTFWSYYNKTANKADGFSNDKAADDYSGMVDLGDWVNRLKKRLPKYSDKVLSSLKEAVVYNRSGIYHNATGLSVYYHFHSPLLTSVLYNSTMPNFFKFSMYADLDVVPEKTLSRDYQNYRTWFNKSKDYLLGSASSEGGVSDSTLEVRTPEDNARPTRQQTKADAFLKVPVDFTKDGDFKISLTSEMVDMVEEVSFDLYYLDSEENIFLELGSDADLEVDWDKGTVSSRFNGYWPSMDGHVLRMELVHTSENYYRYNVPVKVNGKRMDITVIYDFSDEKYHIGAVRKPTDHGRQDRVGYTLKPGDKITTIVLASELDSDEDSEEIEVDTFTYNSNTEIKDEFLGDGVYRLQFMFTGTDGTTFGSAIVESEIKGDDMEQSILDMDALLEDDDDSQSSANSASGNSSNTVAADDDDDDEDSSQDTALSSSVSSDDDDEDSDEDAEESSAQLGAVQGSGGFSANSQAGSNDNDDSDDDEDSGKPSSHAPRGFGDTYDYDQ